MLTRAGSAPLHDHWADAGTHSDAAARSFAPLPDDFRAAQPPARAAGLDTKGDAFPPPLPKEAKAAARWRLKHQISGLLRHAAELSGEKAPSVCRCGTAAHDVAAVRMVRRGGSVSVRGTLACASPWLCPTCAPRRAVERVERLERVFDAAERRGWSIVFVTLTVAHRASQSLEDLKGLVSGASRTARQGRAWTRLAAEHHIEGVMNGPEVTASKQHGWHYHQHLAVLVATNDQQAAEAAGLALRDRYIAQVKAAGGRALKRGQDVQVVWRREDVQSYIAKGSAAWEVAAAGVGKDARDSSLSPWDLAARAGRGDAWATAMFLEYAAVMPGTRSCVVTKSIADKLGLVADDGEGEMKEEEVDETVGEIARDTWHLVLRRGHVPDLLAAVDRGLPWGEIEGLIEIWAGIVPPWFR